MARLDAVEADGADTTVPQPEAEPPEHVDERANVQKASSDDVLAGRTSYVAAMVDGAGAEAVSLTDQTILCIHAHLDQSLTPGQLAKELRVSLRTLERVVAATLECTPSQLIAAMKMREARRLLISGAFRVSEVAYRLGFASPAHFSTRFKSFYRVSPSQMLAQQGAHEADVLTADNGRGPVN
jgi:AraC-like DNA-binding protein